MDECLNDDDDEEHHRVFFPSSGAEHERLSVHAGGASRKTGYAISLEPAGRITWLRSFLDNTMPALAGTDGRSTLR